MYLILRWLINALVILAIAYILPDVTVSGIYAALIAALILGIINALLRPLLILLTLPVNVLTLGLFTLVINALLFWFASTIVEGFVVADFKAAFLGALIMWLASWFTNALLKD
ncbi:MAG: phage holin family protein [Candidatus Buchananbacteria bacterium]|nr:phage holin family protein [Candidatus Buchananbacteria bacterium]